MIEIQNLTKIYQSSKEDAVVANNDISFKLQDTGMVFITGKSGSGKTTLLNILGGLDSKTSGNYFVDGKSITDFKSLDEFRNECVGFVFQDFNLIDSLSVYENINLVLSLQENANKNKISETLKVVGLEGYENRKINELSGGQKQRVAIARAIIKKSKFILADEPTGNLDSETSKDIFGLLKSISKTKLIIVVSHDKSSARKYADRIITLSDGKIESDKEIHVIKPQNQANLTQNLTKHKLSLKYIFTMAKNNVLHHFWKSFLTVVLFALTIFSICLSTLFSMYNSEISIIKTFNGNYGNFYFAQSTQSDCVVFDSYSNVNDAFLTQQYDGINYIKGYNLGLNVTDIENYSDNAFYIITSKSDVENLGLEFYAINDITDTGIYLTDYAIDYLLSQNYVLSDNLTNDDYASLLGQEILQFNAYTNLYTTKFRIDGIIKTDYKNFLNDNFELNDSSYHNYKSYQSYYEFVRQKINLEYIPFYCTEKYIINNHDVTTLYLSKSTYRSILFNTGVNTISASNVNLIDSQTYSYDTIDLYGKVVDIQDLSLGENEIVVNLRLYNLLFDNEISFERLSSFIQTNADGERVCSYNFQHLNQYLSFYFNETYSNQSLLELKNKKIVGVVIKDYYMQQNDNFELYVAKNIVQDNVLLSNTNNVIFVNLKSKEIFSSFLVNMRKNFNIGLYNVEASSIYNLEQISSSLSFLFVGASIIFTIISVLVSINVISFSIQSRKKEIGILRALGTSASNVEEIYICESLIVSIVTMIFSIIFSLIGVAIVNAVLSSTVVAKIYYLSPNYIMYLICFVFSVVFNIVACLIPLKKINQINPIQAIRSIN
jgi:ABC-type lipoprotein export system ATPase subunit